MAELNNREAEMSDVQIALTFPPVSIRCHFNLISNSFPQTECQVSDTFAVGQTQVRANENLFQTNPGAKFTNAFRTQSVV